MTEATSGPIEQLTRLVDELDREVRSLEVARALTRRQVSPELATLAVQGLKHLLEANLEQAVQVFESLSDEIHERTLSLES
jgi:hypothetical protein